MEYELTYTTNFKYKKYIGLYFNLENIEVDKRANFVYYDGLITTSKIIRIDNRDNKILISTKNSVYTFKKGEK